MENKVISTLNLENGLTLIICDESRKLIGDRWLVRFSARIDIPTERSDSEKISDAGFMADDIRAGLGETVMFYQMRERNFIDEDKKEEVLKALCDSFLDSTLSYLAHPDFPTKFILMKYRKHISNRQWQTSDQT